MTRNNYIRDIGGIFLGIISVFCLVEILESVFLSSRSIWLVFNDIAYKEKCGSLALIMFVMWCILASLLSDVVAMIIWKLGITTEFEENVIHPDALFFNNPASNPKPAKYVVFFPLAVSAISFAYVVYSRHYCQQ